MALSITNAQHKNALYYAEWHWDECYALFIVMLSDFMLNVILLNVSMLSVFMMNVIMLNVKFYVQLC